jgi:hypothetical protein
MVLMLLSGLWLSACGGLGEPDEAASSILTYGAECKARIAALPPFDCRQGVIAPITVNGFTVPDSVPFEKNMDCDRPSMLPYGSESDGQCVPGSRALVLADNEQVQISAFCRNKYHRPGNTTHFDEVDVIAHSVSSGSTCWFHAEGAGREAPLDGTRVPPPDEAEPPPGHPSATEFWKTPEETAAFGCGECHDNDPFYWSPFIAQTGQVPADPFGLYANDIGAAFSVWKPPRSVEIRGNTCLGCHRIGASFTCGKGTLQTLGRTEVPDHHPRGLDDWALDWPQSHWMPIEQDLTEAEWTVRYQHSVGELLQCCDAITHDKPLPAGCEVRPLNHGDGAKRPVNAP